MTTTTKPILTPAQKGQQLNFNQAVAVVNRINNNDADEGKNVNCFENKLDEMTIKELSTRSHPKSQALYPYEVNTILPH